MNHSDDDFTPMRRGTHYAFHDTLRENQSTDTSDHAHQANHNVNFLPTKVPIQHHGNGSGCKEHPDCFTCPLPDCTWPY